MKVFFPHCEILIDCTVAILSKSYIKKTNNPKQNKTKAPQKTSTPHPPPNKNLSISFFSNLTFFSNYPFYLLVYTLIETSIVSVSETKWNFSRITKRDVTDSTCKLYHSCVLKTQLHHRRMWYDIFLSLLNTRKKILN